MSMETYPIQTDDLRSFEFDPRGSVPKNETARELFERLNRAALLKHLAPVSSAEEHAPTVGERHVSPLLLGKLGNVATGFGNGAEGVVYELFSGVGARANAMPPQPIEQTLGAYAIASDYALAA